MSKQKNDRKIEQIYKARPAHKKLEVLKIFLWVISLIGLVVILLLFQNSILPYGLFVLIPVVSGVLIHWVQLTKINIFSNQVITANHVVPLNIMLLNYMIIDSKTYRFQLIKSGVPSRSYQLDHLEKIHISDDHKLEVSARQISMPSAIGSRAAAVRMGRYTTQASVKKKYIQRSYYEVKIKIEIEKNDFALEGTKFGIQQLKRVIDQLQRQNLISSHIISGTIDFD